MDMEFDKVCNKLLLLIVNTTAAQEHVAKTECKIFSDKERTRSIVTTLSYPSLLKLILVELLHFIIMWLNSFPVKNGISD